MARPAPPNPTAAQRSNERMRCARTGEPVPEWAELVKSGPGRPAKGKAKPRPAPIKGRGNRPRAHVKAKNYDCSDLLAPPPCLDGEAAELYLRQAKSMAERGVLTPETQHTLIQLAYFGAAQRRIMEESQGLEWDQWIDQVRLAKSFTADIRGFINTLEMRAEDARKGLHSTSDGEAIDDDIG